jgi:hypothetical protein
MSGVDMPAVQSEERYRAMMPFHRPYGTQRFYRLGNPTLKRGANDHCASGAITPAVAEIETT